MSKELYINGKLVDLNEKDNPIALNFAVNNLAELKDRQAFATNNFKLPDTQNNRAIFGLPGSPNFITTIPYRKNVARIVQNGLAILPTGVAIVQTTGDEIEVQVLSGIIGFFESLGDKMISDLNLSAYDHIWNLTNVRVSQPNTSGYIYPIIDYGSLPVDSTEVDVRLLRPATFLHTVISQIITEAGFTFTGDLFNDPLYKRELIPFTNDKFEHDQNYADAASNNNAILIKNSNQTISFTNDAEPQDERQIISFDEVSDPGNHFGGTIYTATEIVNVDVKIRINAETRLIGDGAKTILWRLQKSVDGGWNFTGNDLRVDRAGNDDVIYSDAMAIDTTISLNPGNQLRLMLTMDMDHGIGDGIINNTKAGSVFEITISKSNEVVYGQEVQLAATLPSISQKDMIKDFLQRKGLTVIQDNYSKKLTFVNMSRVYRNMSKAKDWTDKFIRSEKSITYAMSGYAVNNIAKFKKDENVTSGLGDGNLVLDNLTLNNSVDLFTSVFAATENINKIGLSIANIKKIDDPATNQFSIKTEPRILLNAYVSNSIKMFDDEGFGYAAAYSVPYFSKQGMQGITYQDAFTLYYADVKKMLFRPFILKRKARLTELDIVNLDFTIPIFDRETSTYYYLNEINDYISSEQCEVSLIKL